VHAERSCIFEEAEALLALGGYDSPGRITRRMAAYAQAGLARDFGLHHTNFLIRRHRHASCMQFCHEWWGEISLHSKRDQLSFDFIRWKLRGVKVKSLQINYTENDLFRCSGKHRHSYRNTSEHRITAVRRDDLPLPFLATPYRSQYDLWPAEFLKHLRKINKITTGVGEKLEGNLCYFHHEAKFLHSPPDPRRGARREIFLRALADRRRLLEIGFNAGHSALLALTHSKVSVTAIDNSTHAYTQAAAEYLEAAFAGRFQFISMDSRRLPYSSGQVKLADHDVMHIDGAHQADAFASDISCALAYGKPGMLVVIDDIYVPWIRHITNQFVADGLLAPYGDLESTESGVYVVLEPPGIVDATYYVELMNRLDVETGGLPCGDHGNQYTFFAQLQSHLLDAGDPTQAAHQATGNIPETAAAPQPQLDKGIIDKLRDMGFHPFILVRVTKPGAPSSFVVCETQNEVARFLDEISTIPDLGHCNLIHGLGRALQLHIREAAEILYAWSKEHDAARTERVYIGVPQGIELPTYYGYPVLEVGPANGGSDAIDRASQLAALLHAYENAGGNDRLRHALIEALALATARHSGNRKQYRQATEILVRALKFNPSSGPLAAALSDMHLRSTAAATQERARRQ
jgi:hypothetical protein